MKPIVKFFIFLSYLVITAVQAQIFRANQLGNALALHDSVELYQLYRNSALEFHKMLNEHRLEKKLGVLEWDEILWLTSYNHCVWLATNDAMGHAQVSNKKNHTGTYPSERLDFTGMNPRYLSFRGENVLYSRGFFNYEKDTYKTLAIIAFNMWKNSPGHYRNMMTENANLHGMAFFDKGDGKIHGTSMFAWSNDVNTDSLNRYWARQFKEQKSLAIRGQKNPSKDLAQVFELALKELGSKSFNSSLQKATKKRTTQLANAYKRNLKGRAAPKSAQQSARDFYMKDKSLFSKYKNADFHEYLFYRRNFNPNGLDVELQLLQDDLLKKEYLQNARDYVLDYQMIKADNEFHYVAVLVVVR